MKRVCLLTAGQLSTAPRTVKAADALSDVGYSVRVVSIQNLEWATRADAQVKATRRWDWTPIDYGRDTAPYTWFRTALRHKAALGLTRALGPHGTPFPVLSRAARRVHSELVDRAVKEPSDLYLAGGFALGAAFAAARRTNTPYAIDLEDFHSGEHAPANGGAFFNGLAAALEKRALPGAAFLMAASASIRDAYIRAYGLAPHVVHNTFPLPRAVPNLTASQEPGLRLCWFSQTIGPGRGLEDAISAMGLADVPGELHLRGRAAPGYEAGLRALAGSTARRLTLVFHEPAAPDDMIESCRGCDVGLALERPDIENRRLCLTNKAFTYLLAGIPVAMTDVPAQRSLAEDLGEAAFLYAPGDVAALARGLKRWAENREALTQARTAAWEAAKRRWHWEHPKERGVLLELVGRTIGPPQSA